MAFRSRPATVPHYRGVTLKRVKGVGPTMDGADRFMFWALLLVTLLILVGFALVLLGL